MHTMNEAQEKNERTARDWLAPAAATLLLLGLPPIIHALAPAVEGWAIVGAYAVVTVLFALYDATSFRPSWTFPIIVGVAFWIARGLYFNDGSWIYLPVLVALAGASAALVHRARAGKEP